MRDRWGDGVWSALLETRERLAAILPGLFVLVVLLGLGVLLGWIAKFVLERGARAFGFDRVMERWGVAASLRRSGVQRAPSALLARAAHWAIVLFTVATALTHLGIGKEMVLVAFGITFGGLVLALALAFGIGGRHIAAQFLARRLRRESPPPQERLTHL